MYDVGDPSTDTAIFVWLYIEAVFIWLYIVESYHFNQISKAYTIIILFFYSQNVKHKIDNLKSNVNSCSLTKGLFTLGSSSGKWKTENYRFVICDTIKSSIFISKAVCRRVCMYTKNLVVIHSCLVNPNQPGLFYSSQFFFLGGGDSA